MIQNSNLINEFGKKVSAFQYYPISEKKRIKQIETGCLFWRQYATTYIPKLIMDSKATDYNFPYMLTSYIFHRTSRKISGIIGVGNAGIATSSVDVTHNNVPGKWSVYISELECAEDTDCIKYATRDAPAHTRHTNKHIQTNQAHTHTLNSHIEHTHSSHTRTWPDNTFDKSLRRGASIVINVYFGNLIMWLHL